MQTEFTQLASSSSSSPSSSSTASRSPTLRHKPRPAGASAHVDRRYTKAASLAKRLGICPRTLFRWADSGKITRHKINARVVLFDESEVMALIEESRV